MLSKNMPRRIIALLIALFAIAFAFAAMAAIRWPSLMMLAALTLETDAVSEVANIDWRELGIVYGAPYFLASFCLYASAIAVSQRQRGSLSWYGLGCLAGFPAAFVVDFHSGWWRDPSAGEGAVLGAAGIAILLGIALWDLRQRKAKPEDDEAGADVSAQKPDKRKSPKRRRPVPAAILRQRAAYAAEGRRMLARQRRRHGL